LKRGFFKKPLLPIPKGWTSLIEDVIIPLFPNPPCLQHKGFHEKRLLPGLMQHGVKAKVEVPAEAKVPPAFCAEGAGKEQMECGFFLIPSA
jgi:hypothetical protein